MRKLPLAAAAITLMMTTTVLTSCTDDNDNPVVITDDKPFTYDSEIDETVRPGDDFYRYCLGKWLDSNNPSPSFFQQIRENSEALLVKTLTTSNDPLLVQLRSLVDEAMTDDSRSEALLRERLQMLDQVETADQLYDAFAKLHQLGYSPLFRLSPMVDDGKVVINILLSGGKTVEMDTVMAKRDIGQMPVKVASYCQMLSLFGYSEERIAQISENAAKVENVEMSAFNTNFDMLNRPDVMLSVTRGTDDEYKNAAIFVGGLMGLDQTLVEKYGVKPVSMAGFNLALQFAGAAQQPGLVSLFRDYMIYNVISQDAYCIPRLTKQANRFAILDNLLHYNRYYKYRILTEACGYDNIYKQQCQDILEQMRRTFIQRVDNLDWMSAGTKAEASHKAEVMKFYVGYPDMWNDAMTPMTDSDCLLAAATQLRQHSVEVAKRMLGGNVDDLGWDFWATFSGFTTDNSYHLRPANSLIILPAWLTKPRFNSELSEAVIYAAATCFGHEFCHGFDDGGAEYDAQGEKRDWWAPSDKQTFQKKQQALVELYNQLEDYPGQPADGAQTLNENLADYGGVELALDCYKQRLTEQGFRGEKLDEQIKKFFISYAQLWKMEYERSIETQKNMHDMKDTQSLNHVRINGMMRLQDDWYRLYDVQPTDKLYLAPEDRVKIW